MSRPYGARTRPVLLPLEDELQVGDVLHVPSRPGLKPREIVGKIYHDDMSISYRTMPQGVTQTEYPFRATGRPSTIHEDVVRQSYRRIYKAPRGEVVLDVAMRLVGFTTLPPEESWN